MNRPSELTVNNNSGCGASPFGHYVLGHTGVVGCVGQTGLLDDQVVVDGDVKVSVLHWVNDLFIFKPFHLEHSVEQGQSSFYI